MQAAPLKFLPLPLVAFLLTPLSQAATNGLALTPPMGYNSWYINHANINESFIRTVVDTMATNGLRDAGYEYICLDDGWASGRDTNGTILVSPLKFPGGMKALADYVHAKGFKFGIYSAWGPTTCENLPGSCGHVVQDANTYAEWGVDYLKYDACSSCTPNTDLRQDVELMADALLNCGRPILFNSSIDVYHPAPGWAPSVLNSWRGTGDILPVFAVVLYHLDYVAQTPELAGPGHWNDPDVLQAGRLVNLNEAKVDFGMWCMVAAPLLLEDYTFSPAVMQLLTNREVIGVNQDVAGVQGVCVATNGNLQVWKKPLGSDGAVLAVALLNRGAVATNITANWLDLGLRAGPFAVRDLWAQAYAGDFSNSYTAFVPAHGVQLVKIFSNMRVPLPPAGTNYLSELPLLADSTNTVPLGINRNAAGNPMQIHGVPYTNGLGASPYSITKYWLGGAVSRFRADIGLDDVACCNSGSVVFRVWGDGVKLYESGVITSASPVQALDVDLTGRYLLALEVTDAGDGMTNDLADWGGARIVIPALPPAVPTVLSAMPEAARIGVSWYGSPGASGYVIRRALAKGGPYVVIGSSTVSAFSDTNALRDTVYYYEVSAANDYGASDFSAPTGSSLPAYWTGNGPNPIQDWNLAANWTNAAGFPDAAGRSVVINANIAADQTIHLNQPVTLGALTVGDPDGSAAYTIAGNGGLLTLDNAAGTALLTQAASSRGDTLASSLRISDQLTINNFSTQPLTLAGSNFISGNVTISRGVLKSAHPSALGFHQGAATFSADAALELGGVDLACAGVTVSGAGPRGGGVIVNNEVASPASLSTVTLSGDTTFGGTAPWSICSSLSPAVLGTGGNPYNLTKLGSNVISLVSVVVDSALGEMDIQQGTFRFEGASSMGDPGKKLTVARGATLAFNNSSNVWNKVFVLNGDGLSPAITNGSGSATATGPVTLNGDCVIAARSPLTFLGPISGSGGLIKSSGGALMLAGTNLYTGKTVISAGSLALIGSSSIERSARITVAAGAALDASSHNGGGFVLAGGQTLEGRGMLKGDCTAGAGATLEAGDPGGMLAISNSLTLAPGSTLVLGVTYPPATNNPLRVGGNLVLGGALILANLGSNQPTLGDNIHVFEAGSFTGVIDAVLPRIPGPGLLWDTSSLGQDGNLKVIAGTLPQITHVRSGNVLSVYGSGGTFGSPGRTVYLLNGTNAALPMYFWTCVATNHLDVSGNFFFSFPIDSVRRSSFYSVRLQ